MIWQPDDFHAAGHMVAHTEFGAYHIGPRRSDGFWEYCTPDEDFGVHNEHMLDDLSEEQAFAAVEAEYAERRKADG